MLTDLAIWAKFLVLAGDSIVVRPSDYPIYRGASDLIRKFSNDLGEELWVILPDPNHPIPTSAFGLRVTVRDRRCVIIDLSNDPIERTLYPV